MRHCMSLLLLALYIDMYQDRSDPSKTVVVIDSDGVTDMIVVDNKELDDTFINKMAEKYATQQKKTTPVLPRK